MSSERSATISSWSIPSTPTSSTATIGRPCTAPRFQPRDLHRDNYSEKGQWSPSYTSQIKTYEPPRDVFRPDDALEQPKVHRRPPPLALHPPVTSSPLKRPSLYLDDDEQDDSSQAEAGYSRGVGELSANDICVCHAPLSAKKTPRPRNAFILYRQFSAKDLAQKHPGLKVPETSKLLAEKWRALSDEERDKWKKLSEEEKREHELRYPEYRYQPRRKGSIVQSPSTVSRVPCVKCGKFPMVNTAGPQVSDNVRSATIPQTPQSASFTFGSRQLPPMQAPPLPLPIRRDSSRHNSTDIHIPPINPGVNYRGRDSIHTPDLKRRRFSNGSIGSLPPGQPPPYQAGSPQRGSFPIQHGPPPYAAGVRPQMPPPAPPNHGHPQYPGQLGSPAFAPGQTYPPQAGAKRLSVPQNRQTDDLLILPKDQHMGKNTEEILRGGSVKEQLRVLGFVSHPLPEPTSKTSIRGAAVAVEGDDTVATASVAKFLDQQLSQRGDFSVRLAEGPAPPPVDRKVELRDYLELALTWHNKADEIVKYMTETSSLPGESQDNQAEAMDVDPPVPIVVLNRYSYYAAMTWASRVSFEGMYEAKQHWLWFATLWRGIVAADITVYVEDVSADWLSKNPLKAVELCKELRLIFVRREKPEDGNIRDIDDKTLRRLDFEVSEWIREVAMKGKR